MLNVMGLVKRYGSFTAVQNVSFTVQEGHILGFLGPNGAGKTTVLRCIAGYHYPTSGQILLDGIDVVQNPLEAKSRLGYLAENAPSYGSLCPLEYLGFLSAAQNIPVKERRKAVDAALEACSLEDVRTRPIRELSKGYKQRVGIAAAIIHEPSVLLLDEPTAGLDPRQLIEMRALIKALSRKKTVLLSTHILQEVEALATDVLILNKGRVAAQGSLDEVRAGRTLEEAFVEATD
jgi:ABC-2 type transport system ATP-binding protein